MSDKLLSSIMGRDMAVDLGTANTLIYVRGRGIVRIERDRRHFAQPGKR